MAFPMHYETSFAWSGSGEEGTAESNGGRTRVEVGTPSQGGERWNPEAMLLSALEVCLFNTFAYIAGMSKLSFEAYRSDAVGEIELVPREGYRFARATIRPVLRVGAGDADRAHRIMDKAHFACLISRSVNFPVEVEPTILVA